MVVFPPSGIAKRVVETKRALGADEEPYSCRATIPDDGIAPVSAKNTVLLVTSGR
jgi:hypothetical protein